MITYTVMSKEPDEHSKPESGLCLEDAVNVLLARSGYFWNLERLDDGAMHLILADCEMEYFFAPDGFFSNEPDGQKAKEEVLHLIADWSQIDSGSCMIVADGGHQAGVSHSSKLPISRALEDWHYWWTARVT